MLFAPNIFLHSSTIWKRFFSSFPFFTQCLSFQFSLCSFSLYRVIFLRSVFLNTFRERFFFYLFIFLYHKKIAILVLDLFYVSFTKGMKVFVVPRKVARSFLSANVKISKIESLIILPYFSTDVNENRL